MTTFLRRTRLLLVFALSTACDPGWQIDVSITVPADVAAMYSETSRGLLLVRYQTTGSGTQVSEVGIVCGGGEVTWHSSQGGDGGFERSNLLAWIDPLPADDDRPCGELTNPRPFVHDVEWTVGEPAAAAVTEGKQGCEQDFVDIALTLALPDA